MHSHFMDNSEVLKLISSSSYACSINKYTPLHGKG